jgi:site-specific DNA-methyltransferase (adenine-specific)
MSIADVLSGQARWAIVEGDALALLSSLPENSVDLIVTSPPYNLNASPSARQHPKSSRGAFDFRGYGDDDDCLPEEEYQAGQLALLVECERVLKPRGSIAYIHKDRHWEGRSISPRAWLDRCALSVRQQIVWDKTDTHQRNRCYFAPIHEWVFWLTKPGWKGVVSTSTSVWRIQADQGNNWHPATFPIGLPMRCIDELSQPGDLVVDPYSGSGTSGLAAIQSGRRYLGFERQPLYVANSRTRLSAYTRPLALEAA